MAYVKKGDIQNYLAVDISSTLDTQLTAWITSIENYINKYTGRVNGFEGVSSIKYFDGNATQEIDIGDFVTITSVEIMNPNSSGVEFTLTEGPDLDFIIYPYNLGHAYRLILTTNAQIGDWTTGIKRVKVTAVWGASSVVPEDISLATTMLVSSIIEKGMRGGTISSESLGDYSVSFVNVDKVSSSLGVKAILDKYKIYNL